MLAVTYGAGLTGLDGFIITIECSGQRNLPALNVVGLADMAVREAKERIRAACIKTITGHGVDGYLEAIDALIDHHKGADSSCK